MSDCAVRTVSVKVLRTEGDWRGEVRPRWRELARMCQQMANRIWARWLTHHVAANTRQELMRTIEAHRLWEAADKKTRGQKPKWGVDPIDAELVKLLRADLTQSFPTVNSRVRELVLNTQQKLVRNAKSAKTSTPAWIRLLLDLGEFRSYARLQPIPLDRKNSGLLSPENPYKEPYRAWVRMDRIGNGDGKAATSSRDVLILDTCRRGAGWCRTQLGRIASGEWEFKGSRLAYSQAKDEWYLQVCYQRPRALRGDLDPGRLAVLRPGRKRPLRLRISGAEPEFTLKIGGHGRYVGALRRRLNFQRRVRHAAYRCASTSGKGHGRGRWMKALKRIGRRWLDFGKTLNCGFAKEVVQRCIDRKVGVLVYVQPEDDRAETRFLASAGKLPDENDSSGWAFYQLGKILADACHDAGIEFHVLKRSSYGKGKQGMKMRLMRWRRTQNEV